MLQIKKKYIFLTLLISVSLLSAQSSKEKNQKLFLEIQNIISENFYKKNFKYKDLFIKHQEKIIHANSKENFFLYFNTMLSELNASHTNLYTKNDIEYYELLDIYMSLPQLKKKYQKQLEQIFPEQKFFYQGIGIYTQKNNNKVFIKAVLDGSPAQRATTLAIVVRRPTHV